MKKKSPSTAVEDGFAGSGTGGGTALDEVCRDYHFPTDAKAAGEELDPKTIDLGEKWPQSFVISFPSLHLCTGQPVPLF
jgi:hypothetical protein